MGGLLASSCTPEGADDSNITFIDLLSRLTVSQTRTLDYICRRANKAVATGGWLVADPFLVDSEELQQVSQVSDLHRLDLELDHLRSLGLTEINSGFDPDSQSASLEPTNVALQLYARCHGHSGNPIEFYGLTDTDQGDDAST